MRIHYIMRLHVSVLILWVTLLVTACSTTEEQLFTEVILDDPYLSSIIKDPKHEVQILYTQIDRDTAQNPTFKTYNIQLDTAAYFYPASTVKLPASLLALEKINAINLPQFTKDAVVEIDSAVGRQIPSKVDSTAPGFSPTIAHYVKKILLVSDNDAYNRLYEFLGQDNLNQALRSKGYRHTRLIHRLSIFRTPEENLYANPMRFYKGDSLVYEEPLRKSSGKWYPNQSILKGKGYLLERETGDTVVMEPFEFTYKNFYPLKEQHQLIMSLFFPSQFPESAFNLTQDDYNQLYYYMGAYPGESGIPAYSDAQQYWDAYCKFFMFGSDPKATIPPNIRIFNKIGQAYGYLIDNAYIVDFENGVEFFLSAVIHVNDNEVYNDGRYEYDSIGFPFLAELGQSVYEFELKRTRNTKPDLTNLKGLFPR